MLICFQRVYYYRHPITNYRYVNTPLSVYYHHAMTKPSRLYSDILGYPRWSRYWYRYWYSLPSSCYSNYYDSDLSSYSYYWPSSCSRWYNNSWPSSSLSWYDSWPSSLSYKNSLAPYYWSKYWTSSSLPYYSTPSWSRHWRLFWQNYWYRWYDVVSMMNN